ncbi:MAG: sulfotransferase [Myxococcota bacterium]
MTAVAEHLPGEPVVAPGRPARALMVRSAQLLVLALAATVAGPLYLGSLLVWDRPPIVVRARQVARYLRLVWTVHPDPDLTGFARVWLTGAIARVALAAPLWGLAWQLDELLYGRALGDVRIEGPLFEISAARSGSTQLARYLEDDPHLAAPSFLQAVLPFRWMWRLAPVTAGRWLTADGVRRWIEATLPPEFVERHEGDPFRTDTFDVALYTAHLNHLAPNLGPDVLADEFGFASDSPHVRGLWEHDFVALVDRVARKTLLHAGPGPDGRPRRFFLKGHFLNAADALARRYPDARFLTMIREPAARLRSAANYLRANPFEAPLGPPAWAWFGEGLARSETTYCERELAWFTAPEGPRRTVLRFEAYVADLEGSLGRVYAECLDTPALPPHAPRAHPPRRRAGYRLDRTLAQLGVDEQVFTARLAPYLAWCREP